MLTSTIFVDRSRSRRSFCSCPFTSACAWCSQETSTKRWKIGGCDVFVAVHVDWALSLRAQYSWLWIWLFHVVARSNSKKFSWLSLRLGLGPVGPRSAGRPALLGSDYNNGDLRNLKSMIVQYSCKWFQIYFIFQPCRTGNRQMAKTTDFQLGTTSKSNGELRSSWPLTY